MTVEGQACAARSGSASVIDRVIVMRRSAITLFLLLPPLHYAITVFSLLHHFTVLCIASRHLPRQLEEHRCHHRFTVAHRIVIPSYRHVIITPSSRHPHDIVTSSSLHDTCPTSESSIPSTASSEPPAASAR